MLPIKPWLYEIPYGNPCELFRHFNHVPYSILLESTKLQPGFGRYSFIGIDPFSVVSIKNQYDQFSQKPADPFHVMQQWLHQYPMSTHPDAPPFQGGILGFWAYECAHYVEKLPRPEGVSPNTPDCTIGCYDLIIAYDHAEKTAFVIASGYPETTLHGRKQRAENRFHWLMQKLTQQAGRSPENPSIPQENIASNFTQARYELAVRAAQEYILAGDIFEVNLSQCFQCKLPQNFNLFQLYERLKIVNPAPFAGFFYTPEITIISSSPERFIRCHNHKVITCPIKGTARRHPEPIEDKKIADALSNSQKDRAENVMIVDLMRNDLSRVCLPHTVQVPKLCELQTFETVHHLVSTVEGKLSEALSTVDLLKATFPGGSITGAPKIRSMEIITELEQQPRGAYCGSLGYLGFDGTLDTSIAIRTFSVVDNTIYWQAGGAITIDSDPNLEYLETLAKAAALTRSLTHVD